jgi:hypothetical protein
MRSSILQQTVTKSESFQGRDFSTCVLQGPETA